MASKSITSLTDSRDIDKVCDETDRHLRAYLNDRQMQPTDRPNLASFIGSRFLSLSDFLQSGKPASACCYELLFLHEVIFEKLLCDREIQERMEIRMTEYEIHQIINITLRRICAMESGLPVEDVHYQNYLTPRKVVSMVCMPN
jgi:hypothetical protein